VTWIEAIAAVAGLVCVWLVGRQSIWCWPAGLVQVTLYVFVFYDAKLYSDLLLHLIYIVLQVYGWYAWLHGGRGGGALAVTALTNSRRLLWLAVTFGAAAGWGTLMARATDAALPFADAFTLAASLVAQWLQTRKKIESWIWWIGVDVVGIVMFANRQLYITSALYAAFLVLCVTGFAQWRRERRGPAAPVVPARLD
jgi:nicotinamide mononucleotide transporter